MARPLSPFKMTTLSACIALAILGSGCGGGGVSGDTVADASTLNVDEAGKRRRTTTVTAPTTGTTTPTTGTTTPTTGTTTPTTGTTTPTTGTTTPTTGTTTPTTGTTTPTTGTTTPTTGTTTPTVGTTTPSALPLVQATDLVYQGAFRFPELPYTGSVCDSLTYAGRGLAFDPAGNGGLGSLYVTGHDQCGARVAEVSIPSATNTTNLNALGRAQMLQVKPNTLVDALEGKFETSGITGGMTNTVNGLLVYKGNLAISGGNDYSYTQSVSHWSRPKNLSTTGMVTNAVAVSGDLGMTSPRYTAGYMCHVPTEFQPSFGGPALTGWVAQSIVSATSDGPAAFAFDPAKLTAGPTLAANTVLGYPHGYSLETSVSGQIQQTWNWTSMVRGCAMPNGTRTVLFMGSHGTGEFQYGVGGAAGYTNTTPQVAIYDPSDNSTGEHAWPYRYQIWAYDANDMAKVRTGALKPYEVKPYSVWRFTLPFEDTNNRHDIGGMAYDPLNKRIFFVQSNAGPYGEPVVHVFSVANAAATAVSY